MLCEVSFMCVCERRSCALVAQALPSACWAGLGAPVQVNVIRLRARHENISVILYFLLSQVWSARGPNLNFLSDLPCSAGGPQPL